MQWRRATRGGVNSQKRGRAIAVVLAAIVVSTGGVRGEPTTSPNSLPAPKSETPSGGKSDTKPIKFGVPPAANLLIMIRTTLVALQQANVTGNYSVLRDLGTPSFREANSIERLAAAFDGLRTQGGDIAPVVLAAPNLVKPPAVDAKGTLRLTGSFDTKPDALDFDLLFQPIDGTWRLYGIAVQFRPTLASQASGAPPVTNKKADAAPETRTPVKK